MRKALSTLAAFCLGLSSFAQTYPTAFAWPAQPGKDQKEQGPCHIFASVSAVETWFDILYGGVPAYGISQEHLYSFCDSATQFPSTSIPWALDGFKNIGVVDLHQLPYSTYSQTSNYCPYGDGGSTTYFANQLKAGSASLVGGDCGTPYMGCFPNSAVPNCRYRIASYSVLNIGAYTSNNQLKHAIMNYGPIPLWMYTSALYSGTSHAYCLYGWDANGNWLMTDSWPGLPDQGIMKTSLNIDSIFHGNPDFAAYILQPTSSYPAVWGENYGGGAWSLNTSYTSSTIKCIPAVGNPFPILGSSTVTLSGTPLSIPNITVLDNPTITWSFKSTQYNAAVSFNPSTGSSTTATAESTGAGTVYATIKLPNGICEYDSMNVAVHATNIPFTLNQTENLCSGSTRVIQYVASSSYPLTCSWTLHPPGSNQPYTYINGCTFTMDFPQTPSSYGITMTVTSSALPGAQDGGTTGGPAMSCPGGGMVTRDSLTGTNSSLTGVTVADFTLFPNPATGLLNIQLPFDGIYEVRIVNPFGVTMHIRQSARSTTQIDVSHLARGIYFVQMIDKITGALTVRKVLLQ